MTVAVRIFYAAALAQTAARRFDRLTQACRIEGTSRGRASSSQSIVRVLDWNRIHYELPEEVTACLRKELSGTVQQALSLSAERMETVWQEFEVMRAAAQILTDQSRSPLRNAGYSVVSLCPHVRVEDTIVNGRPTWVSPVAGRIATDPDVKDALASLRGDSAGTTDSHQAAGGALQALEFYFHEKGTDAQQRLMRGHSGVRMIPRALWLDELLSE